MLGEARPMLGEARPMLGEARPMLGEARPLEAWALGWPVAFATVKDLCILSSHQCSP